MGGVLLGAWINHTVVVDAWRRNIDSLQALTECRADLNTEDMDILRRLSERYLVIDGNKFDGAIVSLHEEYYRAKELRRANGDQLSRAILGVAGEDK